MITRAITDCYARRVMYGRSVERYRADQARLVKSSGEGGCRGNWGVGEHLRSGPGEVCGGGGGAVGRRAG